MIFKRIVLHNFGLYKGKHEIDLEPPSPEKPIILFGGLNGGGKTTFLTAIQLALYGKFASCTSGNRAYEKVLAGFINRAVNPYDGAAVELEIQHFVDGETENIEERYVQDGQDVWVNTIKAPLRDELGNIIGILGIFSESE